MYTYSNQKGKTLFGDIETYLQNTGTYYTSDYVRIANQIDWDELCAIVGEAYCSNNGRPSKNLRVMLALEILKHLLNLSDEKLVKQLCTNVEVMYFCGIRNMYENNIKVSSSSLTHFRNRLSKYPEILDRIQNIHLKDVIKKLPKKKQGQYDQDSTVIEENIKYPNDINLLNDVVQKVGKFVDKSRKVVGKAVEGVIVKGRRIAKKTNLAYHFTKKKGKEFIQEKKEELYEVAEVSIKVLKKVRNKIRHSSKKSVKVLKNNINNFIKLAEEVLEQQKYLIENKGKSVKKRIVSIYKTHTRTIVKGKQGKRVQFGTKAHIGVVGGKVAVATGLSREREHDSVRIKDGIEIVEKARGKPPSECGYDKGGRSPEAYKYLKTKGIKNGIQGSSEWKKTPKCTRKRMYNRRAFNENIINDVLNHRGVQNNKYRKENIQWSLLMGCVASNMVRIG